MSNKKGAAVAEETAVATISAINQALAVAEGADAKDLRGKENIDLDKLILPRIAPAQKTSPEIDSSSDRFIDGLKLYQMFNSLTGEVYGNGPLKFAVIKTLPFRAMQFDGNQNVVDFNVPAGDPRLQFTTDEAGNRVKPIATEFKEYLVVLEDGSVAALSFKSTQMKVAAKLDSLLTFRKGASWLGLFSITSKGKTFAGGAATQFNILPAGPTPAHIAQLAEEVYENTKGREIEVDKATSAASDEGPAEPGSNDGVPF